MGIPFGTGIQMLFDASQRFTRAALPVFLRVKKFEDTGEYLEVGVPYAPSGTAGFYTGTVDIKIQPPPSVQDVSLHNIALFADSAAPGRLNFGSRIFIISNSFVEDQQEEYDIADPYDVFRNRDGKYKAVGLLYNRRLFSIESITHKEVAGQTINWKLVCNALEIISDNIEDGE